MNVSNYILKTRCERTAHIDLSSPCDLSRYQHRRRGKWARKALLECLGVEDDLKDWRGGRIEICHLCEHDTNNGLCLNPLHLYIGNRQENRMDTPSELRKKGGRASAIKAHAKKDENGRSLHALKISALAHAKKDENGKSITGLKGAAASHAAIRAKKALH